MALDPALEARIKAQEDRLEARPERERPAIVEEKETSNPRLTPRDAQVIASAAKGIDSLLGFFEEALRNPGTAPVSQQAAIERQFVFYETVLAELLSLRKRALGAVPTEIAENADTKDIELNGGVDAPGSKPG